MTTFQDRRKASWRVFVRNSDRSFIQELASFSGWNSSRDLGVRLSPKFIAAVVNYWGKKKLKKNIFADHYTTYMTPDESYNELMTVVVRFSCSCVRKESLPLPSESVSFRRPSVSVKWRLFYFFLLPHKNSLGLARVLNVYARTHIEVGCIEVCEASR